MSDDVITQFSVFCQNQKQFLGSALSALIQTDKEERATIVQTLLNTPSFINQIPLADGARTEFWCKLIGFCAEPDLPDLLRLCLAREPALGHADERAEKNAAPVISVLQKIKNTNARESLVAEIIIGPIGQGLLAREKIDPLLKLIDQAPHFCELGFATPNLIVTPNTANPIKGGKSLRVLWRTSRVSKHSLTPSYPIDLATEGAHFQNVAKHTNVLEDKKTNAQRELLAFFARSLAYPQKLTETFNQLSAGDTKIRMIKMHQTLFKDYCTSVGLKCDPR